MCIRDSPETLPERLRGNLVRAAAGSCVGTLVGRSVRSRLCSRAPRSRISSVTSRPGCLRSSVCCVGTPALALAPLSSGTTFVVFGFCVLMIVCPPRPTSVCSAARLLAALSCCTGSVSANPPPLPGPICDANCTALLGFGFCGNNLTAFWS